VLDRGHDVGLFEDLLVGVRVARPLSKHLVTKKISQF
jgi:hypothetical protein